MGRKSFREVPMKTPKAPEAPDPRVTAAAQTGTNVSTAIANANLNNVNQVTPDGSLTYTQSGSYKFRDPTSGAEYDVPQFTATQSLSPSQQAIKDQDNAASLNLSTIANQQSGFLKDYLGKGIDVSSLPARSTGIQNSGNIVRNVADAGAITKTYNTDFSQDRQRVEDALMARLNPQLQQDREALQTQLSNQGIKLGSSAYDRGLDEFTRQSNDARLGAILNAGQEQSRLVGLEADRANFQNSAQAQQYGQNLSNASFANQAQQQAFGQNMASAQFQNSLRDSALQEQFALRNQPINEIAALMQGSQLGSPNFVNTNMPQIPTVDYAGLVQQNYQNQMGAYQQQVANRNQMMGGLLGAAGTIGGAFLRSDRRVKTDISRVGTLDNGQPVYLFRYKDGGPFQIGLMAQDVEQTMPEAVVEIGGVKHVDYEKAAA